MLDDLLVLASKMDNWDHENEEDEDNDDIELVNGEAEETEIDMEDLDLSDWEEVFVDVKIWLYIKMAI